MKMKNEKFSLCLYNTKFYDMWSISRLIITIKIPDHCVSKTLNNV